MSASNSFWREFPERVTRGSCTYACENKKIFSEKLKNNIIFNFIIFFWFFSQFYVNLMQNCGTRNLRNSFKNISRKCYDCYECFYRKISLQNQICNMYFSIVKIDKYLIIDYLAFLIDFYRLSLSRNSNINRFPTRNVKELFLDRISPYCIILILNPLFMMTKSHLKKN